MTGSAMRNRQRNSVPNLKREFYEKENGERVIHYLFYICWELEHPEMNKNI